ncbi:MAG: hypothetical protein ACI35P_13305 [Bacillus sp. (in: firmicutes)]
MNIPDLANTSEYKIIGEMFQSIKGIVHVRIEPIIQGMIIHYDIQEVQAKDIIRYVSLLFPQLQDDSLQLFSKKKHLKADLSRSLFTGVLLLIAFLRKRVIHRPDAFDYLVFISTSYTVLAHGENKLRHPDVMTGLISMLSLGPQNILQVAMVTWAVNLIEVFNDMRRSKTASLYK